MAREGKATRRSRVGRIEYEAERGHYCTVHGRTAKIDTTAAFTPTERGSVYWVCSMNRRCRPLLSGQ